MTIISHYRLGAALYILGQKICDQNAFEVTIEENKEKIGGGKKESEEQKCN